MNRLFTPEWVFPEEVSIPQELRNKIGGSETFLQILVRRGLSNPDAVKAFLDPDLYTPTSGYDLSGMETAISRILKALHNREKIGIWGDFDVDGQTSTAVLVDAFRRLNADVYYHIPVRGPESHGISIPFLDEFLKTGVSILITCDTGISASEAIEYATRKGIDVIVTDHHTLPEQLPDALTLIDPQFLPQDHPLVTLSGVGVAYKLVECLYTELGCAANADPLLDLVALGLVADLAILTCDARYLVQRGLQRIRNSPRLSLSVILNENNIPAQEVTEETISFVIAPRLNAVGRLADANPMVEFLLADDPVFASTSYNRIEGLNSKRKLLCDQVFQSAQAMLEDQPRLLEKPLIFLGHPEWPAGVVGIVASRLVGLYHRPVILFNTSNPESVKGSARSVDGINITAAINRHKTLLNSFGGHPMAAGLSVPSENFDPLRFALNQTIEEMLQQSSYHSLVKIDVQTSLGDLQPDLVNELSQFAPFGPGNPPVLFSTKDLEIDSLKPLGRTREHEELILGDDAGNGYKVIWWQAAGLPHPPSRFDLAFRASISNFRGKPELRLEWQEYRDSTIESPAMTKQASTPASQNLDFRQSSSPEKDLMDFIKNKSASIYSEGSNHPSVGTTIRYKEISACSHLVIWTIPPSLEVLQGLINKAHPTSIAWFANFPAENSLPNLLKCIGSELKSHAVGDGPTTIDLVGLAGAAATTVPIVKSVVRWYAARGDITLVQSEENTFNFTLMTHGKDGILTEELQEQISKLHAEVQAFRNYYLQVTSVTTFLPDMKPSPRKSMG